MKLRWLPAALQYIERLYEFLVKKSPRAAARAMEIILEVAEDLEDTPEMGKPMDEGTSRRECYLPFGAGTYVLRYQLDGEAIVVIRVWHSREHRT